MQVFTPVDYITKKRLTFSEKSVKVIEGNLNQRGLGLKAIVEIQGKQYHVTGKSCDLPHCQCDAYLKAI